MASKETKKGVFSSDNEDGPFEYIGSCEIKRYIFYRLSDSSCVFAEFHINDVLISGGSDLYNFNDFLQSQDRQEKKGLYHFYTLCKRIYVKARELFSVKI